MSEVCTCGERAPYDTCNCGDLIVPTQQGMVAALYLTKLGRLPTPYEARVVLGEELYELETALSLDATDEDVLHELADVLYTAYGYAIAKGWNLTEAFERIHAANLTKQPARCSVASCGHAAAEHCEYGCCETCLVETARGDKNLPGDGIEHVFHTSGKIQRGDAYVPPELKDLI